MNTRYIFIDIKTTLSTKINLHYDDKRYFEWNLNQKLYVQFAEQLH